VPCNEDHTVRTAFYYLGDDLLFDYTQGTSLIGNYIYANGERIAKFESNSTSGVEYFLTDHLGSVVAAVEHSGALKVRNLYRPWGEKLSSYQSGNFDNQFQYTGQYQDEDLSRELAYYGARYYDQKLKIFTSVDPRWYLDPAFGSYVYTRNNPVKYTDPDGEAVLGALAALAAAAYVVLATPDNVQAPTKEGDHVEQTLGEKAVQWGTALAGAFGIIKTASLIEGRLASGASSGSPQQLLRGTANEAKVLKSEGLAKNSKKMSGYDQKTGQSGKTVPDAVRPDGQLVEIKDVQRLTDSKQLRIQNKISLDNSTKPVQVIIGKNTKVAGTVTKTYDVKRVGGIGPDPR
jgi:RHS repeat-associated protein